MSGGSVVLTALLAISTVWGAETCTPPQQAVERLAGYLSYQAAWEHGKRGTEEMTVVTLPGVVYFRDGATPQTPQTPPASYVYAYRDRQPIRRISCPDNADWVVCAQGASGSGGLGIGTADSSDLPQAVPSCRYTLTVAQWHPTPDGSAKKKLATEILAELRQRGYQPVTVVARDFNMDDPELLLYITDTDGRREMQGCRFNAFGRPHCEWHLFGQAPQPELEKSVTQVPYVILSAARKSLR